MSHRNLSIALAGGVALAALAGTLFARQQTTQPAAPKPVLAGPMQKLAFLVGDWKGSGWIEGGPGQRFAFSSSEVVEPRAGGTVLVVTGIHRADFGQGEMIVHDAFGVLGFDADAQEYRFHTWTARGGGGVHEAQVGEDGSLVWTIDNAQQGAVRFTIRLDEQGRWHEIGEAIGDGGEPVRQFFEMTLEKRG